MLLSIAKLRVLFDKSKFQVNFIKLFQIAVKLEEYLVNSWLLS